MRPNVAPTANPGVTGLVLGLSPNRQGGCSIAQASRCRHPSGHQMVQDTLPDAFRYGSIKVNYNYRARKHIIPNLGPSYIVALGAEAASSGPEIEVCWIAAKAVFVDGVRSTRRNLFR